MKGKPLLILASIFLLIISCTKKEPVPSWIDVQNKKQVVFFSDKEEYIQEISYYDAIIQLKKVHPEEMKNMKILSDSDRDDYYYLFHIDHCPALIVYYNNQVIFEIVGETTTESIVMPVSQILSET
jgi:hypothetical protein